MGTLHFDESIRPARVALLLAGLLAACTGASGKDGSNGTSCSVTDNHDGTATIHCTDGTSATVTNGDAGTNGASCTAKDNGNGTATISCTDGTSATVSNGTNGSDGASCVVTRNADGTRTITCGDGSSVTVSDAVVDYAMLTAGEKAEALFSAVLTSITIPADGRPVLTLKVSERHGYGVKNLSTAAVSWRFAVLQLVPGANDAGESGVNASADDTWVSYLAANATSTASAESALAANLTDNGDGTYSYRMAKVINGGPTTAGIAYRPDRVHRVVVLLAGSGSPFAPVNLVKDFIPATGADVTGQHEKVDPAACLECHQTFRAVPGGEGALLAGEFHSGTRYDLRVCLACHNDQRRFVTAGSGRAFDADINAAGAWTGSLNVVNGEAVLNLPVFIHKIHQGGKLALQQGLYAGVPQPYSTTYPQDVRNCVKCHRAPAAQASRWQSPSRRACGSCHDGVSFLSPAPAGRVLHNGGAAADDLGCVTCHLPSGGLAGVADVHQPVAPPDPNNVYVNPVSGNSNTNAAWLAAEGFVPPDAKKITAVIGSVSLSSGHPVIVFKLQQADPNAVPPVPPTDVVFQSSSSATELMPGFVGGPSAYFVWSQAQDGITNPVDFNGNASGSLRTIWNGASAGSLTGPDGTGFYTLTLTGVTVPAGVTQLTGGLGYTSSLGTAPTFANNTQPLTQVNLWRYPYTPNTSGFAGKGGLIVPIPDVWKVGTGFTARRAIVDGSRCSACHVSLGVTPSFHAGQRNDASSCAFCHRPNQTSNGWSANAKEAIHAIHAAAKRSVPLTWNAANATSGYYLTTYPAPLNTCVACHLPGTYDFSVSSASGAVRSMLPTTVAIGRYEASPVYNPSQWFRISPYVQSTNLVDYGYGFSTTNVAVSQPDGLYGTQGAVACTPASPCTCSAGSPCSVFLSGPLNVNGVPVTFSQKVGAATTVCNASTPCTCTTALPCTGTVATCTGAAPCQAQGTTLVISPITGACVSCHDGPMAIDHMQTNGGAFYEPRSTALTGPQKEQCLLCHGPGRLASIADRHLVQAP